MTLSPRSRLALYILMAILPLWIDFFKLSTDYTFRGLMMPFLMSVNADVIVTLAKISPTNETQTPPTPVAS